MLCVGNAAVNRTLRRPGSRPSAGQPQKTASSASSNSR